MISPSDSIEILIEDMLTCLQVPDWADVVKLGVNRQLAPVDPDWYFVRAASVARHLYFRSPVGKAL